MFALNILAFIFIGLQIRAERARGAWRRALRDSGGRKHLVAGLHPANRSAQPSRADDPDLPLCFLTWRSRRSDLPRGLCLRILVHIRARAMLRTKPQSYALCSPCEPRKH